MYYNEQWGKTLLFLYYNTAKILKLFCYNNKYTPVVESLSLEEFKAENTLLLHAFPF
jgi:hypothetical protein